MGNPPKYIDINEPLTPQTVTTIVVPEDVRQELSWVKVNTRQCMSDLHNLREDFNRYKQTISVWISRDYDTRINTLDSRVSNLENAVSRLINYIEEGIDTKAVDGESKIHHHT